MGKDKKDIIISEKRVKLHIFAPSRRQIWTIVGMGKEYWIDPDLDYCSCEGYYFGRLKNKKMCYHLDSIKEANRANNIEVITFSDSEYYDFLKSLLAEL
ncbi:hypothetical protein [Candidatus Nitrosotenuis uzonensis]|uniref:SWIM-type domain-containing protein n=1 Tax=Candidatus Nitrosotenuis uzonensis TaxID=1407055 RepID=V6AT65_9ARCH|nr:hypothetical protein [Candidatus Nitrosotenuis uzonensis]CDI05842.1 conserved hypothetical protein [Candidatus Nitrosotenuis uzonensis]